METTNPNPAITSDLFLEWRSPRYGKANPERMDNPVWEWLIRSKVNASAAGKTFDGPSAFDAGPGWCFDRFGQSCTELEDGRSVLIAGEHEDSYDPNFFIYNDVVVKNPDGTLEIYGYPRDVFSPTDFHTATLVGDRIFIVGSLGYADARRPGFTQVYSLDLHTFAIEAVECTGQGPGWLQRHDATYLPDDNAILVRGGRVQAEVAKSLENIDDWKLHLADNRWERLTERNWPRWDLNPKERKRNALWEMRQLAFYSRIKNEWGMGQFAEGLDKFRQKPGFEPDLKLLGDLYNPPVPHEKLSQKQNEHNIYRIRVDGVVVRYVEEGRSIRVIVEGELPSAKTELLVSDLLGKITILDNQSYELARL